MIEEPPTKKNYYWIWVKRTCNTRLHWSALVLNFSPVVGLAFVPQVDQSSQALVTHLMLWGLPGMFALGALAVALVQTSKLIYVGEQERAEGAHKKDAERIRTEARETEQQRLQKEADEKDEAKRISDLKEVSGLIKRGHAIQGRLVRLIQLGPPSKEVIECKDDLAAWRLDVDHSLQMLKGKKTARRLKHNVELRGGPDDKTIEIDQVGDTVRTLEFYMDIFLGGDDDETQNT